MSKLSGKICKGQNIAQQCPVEAFPETLTLPTVWQDRQVVLLAVGKAMVIPTVPG